MDVEEFVRAYLRAIETDQLVGREEEWYTPDAVQIEWPNALTPNGATRDLAALRAAGERGRAIVATQRYEVTNLVADAGAGRVAVEAIFRATFRIDLPDLPKGAVMEARFAMFFELADGRIRRHRTYDCFMPVAKG
jgi:ketosteroid isomerase-like protein